MSDFGRLLEEQVYRVTYGPEGENTLWEHRLRLWLRPKPRWCPDGLWQRVVSTVLLQTTENLK